MTKADLAKALYERYSGWLSRKESAAIVEMLFETLTDTLSEGETIKIPDVRRFLVRKTAAKIGRNLQAGIPDRASESYCV